MGWDFTQGAKKKDIVARLVTGTIDHQQTYEASMHILWVITKDEEDKLIIVCYLLEEGNIGWGYKGIPEQAHPYYFSCPMRFLKEVPQVCREWRLKVREYHRDL